MIVLDTHAWVWLLSSPEKLGKKAARAIARESKLGVPAICVWEIAMKAEAGKLRFDRPVDAWVEAALEADDRIELVALSPRVALDAAQLSWDHRDPADRFIVATARVLDAPLATADERIRESRIVKCVWD